MKECYCVTMAQLIYIYINKTQRFSLSAETYLNINICYCYTMTQ